MHKTLILTLALMFALATSAWAADYNAHFGDMDTNGDGSVSPQEFQGHFQNADQQVFQQADANGSGSIDHDEWHAFKEANDYGHIEGKGEHEGEHEGEHGEAHQ